MGLLLITLFTIQEGGVRDKSAPTNVRFILLKTP